MILFIMAFLNAFRLWGFIAGVICLADVFSGHKHSSDYSLGLVVFLIIAGLILPLVGTATWLTPALTLIGLLVAWISLTITAWIRVSENRPLMRTVASGTLFLSLVASFMMG